MNPAHRPQPWEIVRKGHVLDEAGNALNIRRPTSISGLDGLEPGKRYRATVSLDKLAETTERWWWGGEGDEGEEEGGEEEEEEEEEEEKTEGKVTSDDFNAESTRKPLAKSRTWPVDFIIEDDGVEFYIEK